MRQIPLLFSAAALMLASATAAHANLHFTNQPEAATGKFEWDVFTGAPDAAGFAGPHSPDVTAFGGAATLGGVAIPPPAGGPPMVFAGQLYSGGYKARFTPSISGASIDGDFTTLVLQIAFPLTDPPNDERLITPSTILLDGAEATEFVDRGIATDDLHYYWAQWQVAANTNYALSFDSNLNHFALDGVQIEYFNGETVYDAVAAAPVPEPSTLAMAGLSLGAIAVRIAKRRRAGAR